jgi:hypothetical protein
MRRSASKTRVTALMVLRCARDAFQFEAILL